MIYQRIKYFLQTVESQSFSKAAEALYISPQALTKQMEKLEAELGGRLFEHSSVGISLTPFGVYAKETLSDAVLLFDDAVTRVQENADLMRPRINIGVFSAIPQDVIVSPLLSFLVTNFSDYEICIELIELGAGYQRLNSGRLDFLLTNTSSEQEWPGCHVYSFLETKLQIMVSLYHPWVMKDRLTVEDMKKEKFLKLEIPTHTYRTSRENSFFENVPCKSIQKVPNFATILALLGQGNAFALSPPFFANREHAKVKMFDYPDKELKYYTALIYRENNRNPAIDRIAAHLIEEFELKNLS